MRNFKIVLFPNPEKRVITFSVLADLVELDPRGNAIFKTDGRVVGVVSNPAYQYIKEIIELEVNVISK